MIVNCKFCGSSFITDDPTDKQVCPYCTAPQSDTARVVDTWNDIMKKSDDTWAKLQENIATTTDTKNLRVESKNPNVAENVSNIQTETVKAADLPTNVAPAVAVMPASIVDIEQEQKNSTQANVKSDTESKKVSDIQEQKPNIQIPPANTQKVDLQKPVENTGFTWEPPAKTPVKAAGIGTGFAAGIAAPVTIMPDKPSGKITRDTQGTWIDGTVTQVKAAPKQTVTPPTNVQEAVRQVRLLFPEITIGNIEFKNFNAKTAVNNAGALFALVPTTSTRQIVESIDTFSRTLYKTYKSKSVLFIAKLLTLLCCFGLMILQFNILSFGCFIASIIFAIKKSPFAIDKNILYADYKAIRSLILYVDAQIRIKGTVENEAIQREALSETSVLVVCPRCNKQKVFKNINGIEFKTSSCDNCNYIMTRANVIYPYIPNDDKLTMADRYVNRSIVFRL